MRASAFLYVIAAFLLAGGGARLAYLEHTRGPELRRQAERQQRSVRLIAARRGEILDTRGRVLAGTIRRPSAFVDPALVSDERFAAYSVAPLLDMKPEALEEKLRAWREKESRFEWLKRRISTPEAEALEALAETRRLRAFGVQRESVRVYPQGCVAPHILGFVGADAQGLAGIEARYDALLSGQPGRRLVTVDLGRRRVRSSDEDFTPAVDGATLVLTIDAYIQEITQQALRRAWEKHKPEWAAAVVLDPQSGEVLAMASLPDFDPSNAVPADFGKMSEAKQDAVKATWRNRTVSDSFEPGSVFKPFIASCALDEGLVRIDEVFAINGPVRDFGRRTIRDTHPYGALAMHEVISKSSNIGMGMVGARCGMERLHRYVRSFGFGDLTGVELPGEHTGLVQDFSKWNPSFSPQSIPIGQEISITPIQAVAAFSVFCNGGVLLRPRIVRGAIGPDGQTLLDNSLPITIRRVLDEKTVDMFRKQALVETVTDGTGKSAKLDEYQVFGKTGTAQIAAPGGRGYLPGKYVGSFIAGAPSDYPRAVVMVSIYKPSGGQYYGGTVAAPTVKEILADTLAYMQVPPELTPEPEKRPVPAGRRR